MVFSLCAISAFDGTRPGFYQGGMLREFLHVRQEGGPGRRRWFESEEFDLVVWLDAREQVVGYQICYDLGQGERALTWRPEGGFAHHAVDSGDTPDGGGAKLTPILVADGAIPWPEIDRRFARAGQTLEPALRELVGRTLQARR